MAIGFATIENFQRNKNMSEEKVIQKLKNNFYKRIDKNDEL